MKEEFFIELLSIRKRGSHLLSKALTIREMPLYFLFMSYPVLGRHICLSTRLNETLILLHPVLNNRWDIHHEFF